MMGEQHREDMPQMRTCRKPIHSLTLDKTMALFHHSSSRVACCREQTNFDGPSLFSFIAERVNERLGCCHHQSATVHSVFRDSKQGSLVHSGCSKGKSQLTSSSSYFQLGGGIAVGVHAERMNYYTLLWGSRPTVFDLSSIAVWTTTQVCSQLSNDVTCRCGMLGASFAISLLPYA